MLTPNEKRKIVRCIEALCAYVSPRILAAENKNAELQNRRKTWRK